VSLTEQIEQVGWSKPQVDEAVSGKADVCRQEFKAYRQAIHPNLKWNWAVEEITEELQLFYEAFEAGKRPKLAIEMPPQHGKSLAAEDFISWVSGKRPEIFQSVLSVDKAGTAGGTGAYTAIVLLPKCAMALS
jgi:hypothetical protein